MHRSLIALAALALCGAARAEWRATIGLGDAFTKRSSIRFQQPGSDFTVDRVHWIGRGGEIPPWYDIRLTRFLPRNPNVGITLGLMHAKAYAHTRDVQHVHGVIDGEPVDAEVPMHDYVQQFNISHGVNFIELGITVRKPLGITDRYPNGRVQPYAGVAVGPVINHPENIVMGRKFGGYRSNHNWGYQALAGIHYGMNPRWGLYAEAKATHVRERVPTDAGHATTTLNSAHLSAGVSYTW